MPIELIIGRPLPSRPTRDVSEPSGGSSPARVAWRASSTPITQNTATRAKRLRNNGGVPPNVTSQAEAAAQSASASISRPTR